MSIAFASTVTAPEGSAEAGKCVNRNCEWPLGNNRLTWDRQASQKPSRHIILHTHVSAHTILDPASFFEVPFPILNSFLIPSAASNWRVITSTRKTAIPACVANGF